LSPADNFDKPKFKVKAESASHGGPGRPRMGRDPVVALSKSVTKNVDAYAKDEGLESRRGAPAPDRYRTLLE